MNTFFVNTAGCLDLKKDDESSLNPINSKNINNTLEKHKNHPSTQEIYQTFMTNKKFSFKFVTQDLVREEIMNVAGSKTTPIGNICVDILKSNLDIHLLFIKKQPKVINRQTLFS